MEILKKILYSLALILLIIIIVKQCGGSHKTNTSNEINYQYDGFKNTYKKLILKNKALDDSLKTNAIQMEVLKKEKAKAVSEYRTLYAKGRIKIINAPCNDSVHIAEYDSLNANCERVQAKNEAEISKYDNKVKFLNEKITTQDSTIANRNGVINLNNISIALARDSLKSAKKQGNKKAVKWFFIGVGVGAAAKTGADALLLKK